ncbi:hypothetical protein BX265_7397 [Streptomyces sp. TLI_235]|nr:hypothetical protein BX265_7397 [Streptomyces sp. TLI_235]
MPSSATKSVSPIDDPLFGHVPADRRLAAVLDRLALAERAFVLALGHP